MLLGHPVRMAQQTPPTRLFGIRGPGRPRQAPSVAPVIDLQAEYHFWHVYERVVRPLPGGGLPQAWLVCQKVYRDRWQHPEDSDAAGLSRVLFGDNMTAGRASELAELHALVSRRVALLAKRGRLHSAA
ncbi:MULTISPECIES: hypothetical protein [Stenotrophomonas]|uniref:Uncharacterized protein n=1 Tax=Stenotrophomonas sepilia TaxID=2860290 RepID=A0ABQ6Q7K6_9GAMM|nr:MULTISPECIES: hypothetical protein [Stenotrophomonas maltophilia group]AYA92366.1 hypothetical protein PEM_17050 [Stenotrophomonas sp. Pemsol]QCZ98748.1 hypothetical protein DL544_19765 [Stenotrophomonas sp. pho]MBN4958966.1 hypothetical protein [Stenotrophomonas maltophilia]MBN4965990.1 hypothetical protein [Stenotrophomonas maltophilia]MCF3468585.1 hypothetical protein [Stenotrophomonas maltophilia]